MTDTSAVLFAALIGALGGLVGGGVAALSAIRSSQLAARVPLGAKVHALGHVIVKLKVAIGTPDYDTRLLDFNVAWNDLVVHQKILAPSHRIGALSDLVLAAVLDPTLQPTAKVALAGDALNAITEMISAQSGHLFRWVAVVVERRLVKQFTKKVQASLSSPQLRGILAQAK